MAICELFITILAIVPVLFYGYVKWLHTYWARRNMPHIKSTSIWGNMENPFRQKHGLKLSVKNAYDEFKTRGLVHGGIYLFTQKVYLPVNIELVKNILSKDFKHFNGHGHACDEKNDPLSAHLLNLDGERWRNIRVKVTPNFTSGKMKMMFNTLLDCGGPMINYVENLTVNGNILDTKDIVTCFTTDVIGSCAFGLSCNSFKEPDAEFRKYGRQVVEVSPRNKVYNFVKFVTPGLAKRIHVRRISLELESFFIDVIKKVLNYRKSNGVERNDFMQLFLEMEKKAKAKGETPLTINQIAAQGYIFFVAGFETSATTMSFLLHELAFNQGIQDRLRDEIQETLKKYDGKLTYEGIMEMKYLDQVVCETLRKYPPLPFLNRVCTEDYKVPNTNITIEKGMSVVISALGIQRDEEYYPDPEKFDPERFTEENTKKRPPFSFIPFGEGPRICIGLRFGTMQTKTGVSLLLSNFKFSPAKGCNYNFKLEPTSLILSKDGPMMLNAVKLTN